MRIKKLTLLLLALSLTGGFLTGCAKSDEEKVEDAVEDAADAVKDAVN